MRCKNAAQGREDNNNVLDNVLVYESRAITGTSFDSSILNVCCYFLFFVCLNYLVFRFGSESASSVIEFLLMFKHYL